MGEHTTSDKKIIRDLGDGLVLRHATPTDADVLAHFNSWVHAGPDPKEPDETLAAWTRELLKGDHPTMSAHDFMVVEDTSSGEVVSTTNLISQVWSYGGIPFKVGRPEMVATKPEYRNKGLVRAQFEELHRWSAERGEIAQAITGIPFYYRQFGYELTLAMPPRRIGYKAHIPRLKEGDPEPYNMRPARDEDVPFIKELYDRAMGRYLISAVRDEALWRYELHGREEKSTMRMELRIVETPEGETVGMLAHRAFLWGPTLAVDVYELKPGASWVAVTPSVLRYLGRVGAEYEARDKKDEFGAFMLQLGEEHPSYDIMPSKLPRKPPSWLYYMRVPDLPVFLRHIAPVLEKRLSTSALAGHTGELKLNFYRSALKLAFEGGRLASVEPYKEAHQEDGDIFFPNLTFLHLLFGHLELEELERVYGDCWVKAGDEQRLLVKVLFPREGSWVMPVG